MFVGFDIFEFSEDSAGFEVFLDFAADTQHTLCIGKEAGPNR